MIAYDLQSGLHHQRRLLAGTTSLLGTRDCSTSLRSEQRSIKTNTVQLEPRLSATFANCADHREASGSLRAGVRELGRLPRGSTLLNPRAARARQTS